MFFQECVAYEPLPSSKIDIVGAFIRSEIRQFMSSGTKSDLQMSWNKVPFVDLDKLPLEEQCKMAIKRINALGMKREQAEKAIKELKEKLKRLQDAELKKD